eukprot:m.197574 g.197574  ORF g.197574 m.197574 type:complete len:90 (+) comp18349_c0_seq5:2845-3114(+)
MVVACLCVDVCRPMYLWLWGCGCVVLGVGVFVRWCAGQCTCGSEFVGVGVFVRWCVRAFEGVTREKVVVFIEEHASFLQTSIDSRWKTS